jgi:hypothetical protein
MVPIQPARSVVADHSRREERAMEWPMNEAREVFRSEAREGHYIRLIVAGEIDEAVLDGLEDFIAWRRQRRPIRLPISEPLRR